MIIIISLAPVFIYLRKYHKDNALNGPFPFFPFVGIFYVFFFGAPIFLYSHGYFENDSIMVYSRAEIPEINPVVLGLVFTGLLVQAILFYTVRSHLKRFLPRFSFSKNECSNHQILFILYFCLFVGHALHGLVEQIAILPSIGQFLQPVGPIAIAGMLVLLLRGSLSIIEKIVFFIFVVPMELAVLFQDLLLANKFMLVLLIFVVFLKFGQIKRVMFVGLILVFIVQLYSVTLSIRSVTFGTPVTEISRFIKEVKKAYLDGRLLYSQKESVSAVVHRFSQIWVFHHVYNQSPDPIPYLEGKTYLPLLTSIIPRVIYPDKPREVFGNEFGKRYKLLRPNQNRTSMNIPWITELLVNFGGKGVIIGMALIGLFLGCLDRIFNSRNISDLEFAVGIGILLPLVRPESNFSVMVGSIIPLTICLYIYFRWGGWILEKLPIKAFARSSVPSA